MSKTSARVLILSGVQGDTRRYRAFHLWQQLRLAGVESHLTHITSPSLFKQASQAEVVILQRVAMDRFIESLLNLMRRHKALIIYDTDDLLFDPSAFQWIDSPDFSDPVRARLYQMEMRRHKLMLDNSDAALVSTEYLADRVKAVNKPVWIHRNAFSLEMDSLSEKAQQERSRFQKKLIIGYASGTPTHDRDFAFISPALRQILRDHQDVALWLVGPVHPGEDWSVSPGQLNRIPFVPWRKLPGLLAQFDINLAPLVSDNPFSLSKSEVKYIEAGLVSVPTLASRTPAFEFAIQNGSNSFLASNEGEWLSMLEQVVSSPELRQQTGRQARAQVLERYNPLQRSREIVATLNLISSELRGDPIWDSVQLSQMEIKRVEGQKQTECYWIPERLESHPTMIQRAGYQLRHRSISSLAGYVWIYVRRRLTFIFPFRKQYK